MRILIAILGCHARPMHRRAQRETWIKDLPPDSFERPLGLWPEVDYRYFIGQGEIDSYVPELDAVYLDVPDTYPKLPLKTRGLMLWALERGYDWVFKCDDDTYIRVARMLASNWDSAPYSGFCGGRWGKAPGPDGQEIVYAYAQGGAGYWVNRDCVRILAEHLLVREYCEDVSVGKTLALHGIQPVHDTRYAPQVGPLELDYPEARANFLTLHKVSPDQMRRLYAADGAEREAAARTQTQEVPCLSV